MGRCPVERRGEIPSVRPSVHTYVCTYIPPTKLAQAAQRQVQAAGLMERLMDRQKDGRTDGQMEFPHCVLLTSSAIGSAALPTSSLGAVAYSRARVPLTS